MAIENIWKTYKATDLDNKILESFNERLGLLLTTMPEEDCDDKIESMSGRAKLLTQNFRELGKLVTVYCKPGRDRKRVMASLEVAFLDSIELIFKEIN